MGKGKILVTGGVGFIGSHTVVELIQAGYEVEILDNLFNSKVEVLDKIREITGVKPKFHEVDMCDDLAVEKVFAEGGFDTVMHFAGLKAVGESVEQPLNYYAQNIGGTLNILKAMRNNEVHRIIFSSSATVYGEPKGDWCTEDMPTGENLSNPYGRTKYFIEQILIDVAKSDPDFQVVLLRYFNPIGAHPSGLIGENPNGRPNNLMPIIMKVATGEYPELTIYGNDYPTADGTCVRDYIHVVDLARGHLAALMKLEADVDKKDRIWIYNLGSGKGTSVLEMVKIFSEESGRALPHKVVERRAGDLPTLCANPKKAERELNWKTELSVNEAVRDSLNFWHQNEAEI